MTALLDRAFREAGGRIVAALAARFRDLDLAEESFAEACARAVAVWGDTPPADAAAWLYRASQRAALDTLRRRAVRARLAPEPPEPEPTVEDEMASDHALIPDERLRLIFICCHPAVAAEARAALTLRLVCRLSTKQIAQAFLIAEPTLLQRLTRAKHKIAAAGIPFGLPAPQDWAERLGAVLSTIEVAYSKAHEDAAGTGGHAGFAGEMLALTALLAKLMPDEDEVKALAATIRFAEARRPARVDADGCMVPLAEQDPARWDPMLIADGHQILATARSLSPRVIQAAIHGAWCARPSLTVPAPWPQVLALYDRLLAVRDDVVVRLNRLVALAQVDGPYAALAELALLDDTRLAGFTPYLVLRADLMRRTGHPDAGEAYARALAAVDGEAERRLLERRMAACP